MPEIKVQSLDRTFSILEILARAPNGLSLVEIAAAVDLPKSTAFRLLAVLIQHEYVRKTDDALYKLGPGFIELASHYLNSLELKTESAPFMRELAANLGTIVFCPPGRRDDGVYRQAGPIYQPAQVFHYRPAETFVLYFAWQITAPRHD